MRHAYYGKKLSRTKNERKQLFRELVRSLLKYGSITTTRAKAKAIVPMVEKLITKAKRAKSSDIQILRKTILEKSLIEKLLKDAKQRFNNRTSGFTRTVKIGFRAGDGSEKVLLSFTDEEQTKKLQTMESPDKRKTKNNVKNGKNSIAAKKETRKK